MAQVEGAGGQIGIAEAGEGVEVAGLVLGGGGRPVGGEVRLVLRLAAFGGHDVQDGRGDVAVEGAGLAGGEPPAPPRPARRRRRRWCRGCAAPPTAATGCARRRCSSGSHPGGRPGDRAGCGPPAARVGRPVVGDDPVEEPDGADHHRPHAGVALAGLDQGPGQRAAGRPAGRGRPAWPPRCPRPGCTARGAPGRRGARPGAPPARRSRPPGSSPSPPALTTRSPTPWPTSWDAVGQEQGVGSSRRGRRGRGAGPAPASATRWPRPGRPSSRRAAGPSVPSSPTRTSG